MKPKNSLRFCVAPGDPWGKRLKPGVAIYEGSGLAYEVACVKRGMKGTKILALLNPSLLPVRTWLLDRRLETLQRGWPR